jgi:hypothetical protein
MKRSEMVKRIAKWLDRSQSTVLMNGNEGKAESLLKQIEVWEMLPPPFDVFKGRKDTFNDKMMVNQWEPEDV